MHAPGTPATFAPALTAMVATQIAAACVIAAVPVMAPAIALDIGADASLVGIYAGLVFTAATLCSAWSGTLIARLGPVRTNQLALCASAIGVTFACAATLPFVALAGLLVGAGYGPNTPSSSQVLSRVTPAGRRALVFSLKQSGSPLGGMLAGFMLPPIVALAGWQAGLTAVLVLALTTAALVQPLRRRIDALEPPAKGGTRVSALASMRLVLGDAPLRRLTCGGLALMAGHACFQTFFVAYLVTRLEVGLALAGVLFATLQAAGAVARIVIGWSVDRLGNARATLTLIAGLVFVVSLLVAAFSPAWPMLALAVVSALAGAGSSGWYGAFLSEVVRVATAERAGFATGGVLFFVYGAHVAAPVVAAVVVTLTGSYVPVFVAISALAVVAALAFARLEASA